MRATSESAEWIFLATNLGLEMLSAACDQASSPRRPQYAQFGMLLAIAAVLISISELIYRGKKEGVVLRRWGMLWWFYHPPPLRHTPFGTLPDIYGLVAAISQCICSIVQYVYCLRHADNPFKASLLPAIFLVCLGGSKLSNNRMNADTTDNKDSWENSSRQKTRAMNECLSDLQQNHAQSDELDQSCAKPTHQSAFVFAAVAVAVETANSGAGSEPGLAVPKTGPRRRLWVKDRKNRMNANTSSSCHLCKKNLHGKDIYMYRGESAFCSTECRATKMMMDERKERCRSEALRSVGVSGSSCLRDQIFSTGILVI